MRQALTIVCLILCGVSVPAAAQTPFAQGLQLPQRLIFTPVGNLLVSEGGTANANTGRISILSRQGVRRSLIEGLPAAPGHGITAFGPAGMGLDGRTLYLVIGEGNLNVGPPFSLNLAGPSSPIFASVLRIQFSADVDTIDAPFQLTLGGHWALMDGYDIVLTNASGARATVHLLTAFRTVQRNILGSAAPVRTADPYSAWLDAPNNALYVTDPSSEIVVKVNTVTGRYVVLTRFQPDERAGSQFVDTVPTAACPVGDSFAVSFLSANPFPAGAASVRMWNAASGAWARIPPFITGLTMANDVYCLAGGTPSAPRLVTVEYSQTADRTIPSGRVQFFNGTQGRTLLENILLPTAVTQDPVSGDLFVLTLGGTIYRAPLP